MRRHGGGQRAGFLLAVLLTAYGVTWAVTALGALALQRAGMLRSEAVLIASMLGFLVYLGAVLAAVASRRPRRALTVLVAAGGAAWGTALSLAGGG